MIRYLVCKQYSINTFKSIGPNYLSRKLIDQTLSSSKDIFVFDNLIDAKDFATTIGCAITDSFVFPLSFVADFPIFEIELPSVYSTEDRTLPAIKKRSSPIVYISPNKPYPYLERDKTFKVLNDNNLSTLPIRTVHSARDFCYTIQFPCIKLPFFHAMNPLSEKSGVYQIDLDEGGCVGSEKIDETVSQSILNAMNADLDIIGGIKATFDIIWGNHYSLSLEGKGAKGLLDLLILPLLARKLISDTCLAEHEETILQNIMACIIAIPIELSRVGVAFGLTMILIPIITAVHLIRNACQLLSNDGITDECGSSFSCNS